MSKYVKGAFLIPVFFILIACTPADSTPSQTPKAINAVIDLRDWDFEKDGSINLSGEWGFYWNELVDPDQIATQNLGIYVAVPDTWTSYSKNGENLPPEGFATYNLTVYLPDDDQVYGLYNEGQGSAYKLWVDGRLLAQNGQVGTDSRSMTPEKKPGSFFFQPDGEMVEMVLQISNFNHRKAGFRNTLLLGMAGTIHQHQMQSWFIDAFSVGTLFVMGLYYIVIYIFRSKDKAPLYFGILCWLAAVRIGVTNQNTLLTHLPSLSWETALRIEYLTFFFAPPLFTLFMKHLYPRDVEGWFVRLVLGLGIFFSLFVFLSDTLLLSYTSSYYQYVILLEMVYFFVFLGRIIARRREGAIYIGIASLVLFAATIYETLYLRNIIDPIRIPALLPIGQISSMSMLAYTFVQAILLSSRFSKSFYRVETLSDELEEMNINLQQSERKYRTIFEESKDMIFIAALDSKIEDVSPACEEILGYTKDELLQMRLSEVILHQEDSSRFQNAIIQKGVVRNLESDLQRKDGKIINTLVSATPRLDEKGNIIGVQGSVRDITDRKQAEVERMRALELEQIAITDALTKIYNRRFFHENAQKEISRAIRSDTPLSIILFDIDYFKNINDTYGHLVGDQVLINLSNLIQQNIRSIDLFARFGGEEFVILMPDTNSESARESAERLRRLVAEKPVATAENNEISLTISMGVACWNGDAPLEYLTIIHQADQALYQAKEAGRDCVICWENQKSGYNAGFQRGI